MPRVNEQEAGIIDKVNLDIGFIRSVLDVTWSLKFDGSDPDIIPLAYEAIDRLDTLRGTINKMSLSRITE